MKLPLPHIWHLLLTLRELNGKIRMGEFLSDQEIMLLIRVEKEVNGETNRCFIDHTFVTLHPPILPFEGAPVRASEYPNYPREIK